MNRHKINVIVEIIERKYKIIVSCCFIVIMIQPRSQVLSPLGRVGENPGNEVDNDIVFSVTYIVVLTPYAPISTHKFSRLTFP